MLKDNKTWKDIKKQFPHLNQEECMTVADNHNNGILAAIPRTGIGSKTNIHWCVANCICGKSKHE